MPFFSRSPPLKTLAQKARSMGWSEKQLRDYLQKLGFSVTDIGGIFDPKKTASIVEQSCDRVLKDLERTLQPSGTASLRARLLFDVPNNTIFNCAAEETKNGRVIIRVAAGFLFLLNKLAEIYTGELLRGDDALSLPPSPEAVQAVRLLVDALYDGERLQKAWSVVAKGSSPVRADYIHALTFGSLLDAAVAHELQHALYFLADSLPTLTAKYREAQELFVIVATSRPWGLEMGADNFSVRMTPHTPGSNELTRRHALFMLLELIALIERTTAAPESETHPPAWLRLEALKVTYPDVAGHRAVQHFGAFCHAVHA